MMGIDRKIEIIENNKYKITETVKRMTEYGERLVKQTRIVENPIDIWFIGNTGMRNPWRIPSGFKAYVESNMVGRLREADDQKAFKKYLAQIGEIGGSDDRDESASITRKYRLMFNKFGFTYPEVTKKDGFNQDELGQVDCITPLGQAFYTANTITAQQECFLRGMIVPMEPLNEESYFSPLLWTLNVMLELGKKVNDTKINFIEFATCVQTTNPLNDINRVVEDILNIREERSHAENKKKFDREMIDKYAERYIKARHNFLDYADMNIRYLICSGIVKHAGRGIMLIPEYHSMAKELVSGMISSDGLKNRYIKLCNGAELPTDNTEKANKVLEDLVAELEKYHITYSIPDIPLDSAKNINIVRNALKQDIDKYKEELYAKDQENEWKEIYEYMNLLIVNNGHEKELDEDYIIRVPKSEAAAYLEWTLWRAFLAIDHTKNKPYQSRGFNIDQDYFPVGTAPGGGPDMIFEFENYYIAVEVTMSTNSRQEAMEGEPVRRHVADLVMSSEKPVYGVFIANKIDSNTAETFRIGVWYNQNDEKLALKIVPFTLKQFAEFFRSMFENHEVSPDKFLQLFEECFSAKADRSGPEWKQEIEDIVQKTV